MSVAEKPEECDSCRFKTFALTFYREPLAKDAWLCALCANTKAGHAYMFPLQHLRGDIHILQTICYVGNEIIAAVKASGEPPWNPGPS